MRTRLVAAIRLVALVGLEAAALVLLLSTGRGSATLDWRHLGRWLGATTPEDAVVAVVRVAGIVVAGWLLATTTTLYLLARLARLPGLLHGIRWATLPSVRRVVDAAVAASVLAGAVLAGPSARAQAPQPAPIVVDLSATTTTALGHRYVPVPAGDPGVPGTTIHLAPSSTAPSPVTSTSAPPVPAATARAPAPPAAADPVPGHAYTVVPDDNLWTIAAAELSRQTGRGPDHLAEAEIRRYWLQVIDANRTRIRSGDPNLIFPGESILCPPAR